MALSKQEDVRNRLMSETYKKVMNMLKKNKRCLLIRPTGFGKTYLMSHLTNEFKKVLYMYPIDIIKIDIKSKYRNKTNPNMKYLSYRGLVSKYKKDKEELKNKIKEFDLIICDEAHMAGAEKTYEALMYCIEGNEKQCLLGATATPDRSDGFNIIGKIFNDHVLDDYTLSDAINDGLIPKPHYVYSLYETKSTIKDLKSKANKNIKSKEDKRVVLEKLSALEIEMSNILNASEILKENVDKIVKNQDYMKFIVFFSEKIILTERLKEVEGWFKKAFKGKRIRNLIITSDTEYRNNVNKLGSMTYNENTIDLIFCIDMLNMGYHIDDITGIVMLRGTSSNIIYKQQVGRCISAGSESTPIIFDFVNNILRKPYYNNNYDTDTKDVKEGSRVGERLNDLGINNITIDDRVATYRKVIDKIVYEMEKLKLEDAAYLYVHKSMPMKVVVKHTGIKEEVIRREFIKMGITLED